MKLMIEVFDWYKDGELYYDIAARIAPCDSREGISTLGKSEQTERLARLIDLSKALEDCIEDFYSKVNTSALSQPINSSGGQGSV